MSVTSPRCRPLLVVVALLALAVGAVPLVEAPASAAPAPTTGTEITGVQSGKCLTVSGAKRTPRASIEIYTCLHRANQRWTLTEDGRLTVYDDDTCLNVYRADTTSPATIQTYPCVGAPNEKWEVRADGSIRGVQSGLCLDVFGRRTANKSEVGLYTCKGRVNQAWTTTLAGRCTAPICNVQATTTESDIPWGLQQLADGSVLYTRRDAHDVIRFDPDTGKKTSAGTVPNVQGTDGEGGLMGLTTSPDFADDHWVYLMHSSPTDNRIVRIKYENGRLQTSTEQVLLTGIQRNKFHDGGRLRFGPDGKLYATTGDARDAESAQDLASLNGKILRLNADGSVPADNPFGTYVWSYGHRNPQGLAFDSQGRLWEQEFGNSIMDETNLITKGANYGWPACEGTSGDCATPGFVAPRRTYTTAEGSCAGIAIVHDVLYVACERGTKMYRHVIEGSSLTQTQVFFDGVYGRLRTVEPALDGGLWLTTTTTGDKDSTPNNSNEKILHLTLGGT